jgi:hypothetical protein
LSQKQDGIIKIPFTGFLVIILKDGIFALSTITVFTTYLPYFFNRLHAGVTRTYIVRLLLSIHIGDQIFLTRVVLQQAFSFMPRCAASAVYHAFCIG